MHIVLVNTFTPANAQIFFAKLCQVVSYDIFGGYLELGRDAPWFSSPPDSVPLTINFDALGYETAFYWINMRSVIIIYCITPFYLLVIYSTYWVASRGWFPTLAQTMRNALSEFFFNTLISLTKEMYLIVVICILVNINEYMVHGMSYDLNLLAVVLNSIAVLGYPVLCIALCFVDVDTVQSTAVTSRIGVVYADLNVDRLGKLALIEPIAQSIRRLILGAVLVFMTGYPIL